jgi:CHASE2 domain-containing sensor protein
VSSAASEPLSRSLAQPGRLIHLLHSPVLKALVGANIIVAAIIVARSDGWLQPFELLIYDALRVAWAGHDSSNRLFLVGGTEDDVADFDWPLRDGELADLLERLASWNPRSIGVDIYRDKLKPPGTERLAEVLARHKKLCGSSSSRRVRGGRYYPRKCFAAPSAPFLPISYLIREM